LAGKAEYAFEFKNASISSRPDEWQPDRRGWKAPTLSGRLGLRPAPAWRLGMSYSGGSYLMHDAEKNGLVDDEIEDFLQNTLGFDMSYEWRALQLWSELFLSRFHVPNVGHADTLAYYVEAKYKLTARFFGALRWNQQFFGQIYDGFDGRASWDRAALRVDTSLGCRLTRHTQGILQYSYTHMDGPLTQGENYLGGRITVRF
jgi:hypothetical protein